MELYNLPPNVRDADMSHTILQGLVFALGSWVIGCTDKTGYRLIL